MQEGFRLFPPEASTLAGEVDALYFFLIGISAFFTLLIAGLIAYFALRYRRRSEKPPQPVRTDMRLELTWTIIPLGIVMVIFVWGANVYVKMFNPPEDALDVYVIGKQWMWKMQHSSGRREINELHVPLGQPVKLTVASQDVIHSFYIPAFRVKHDVLPGRYTSLWFEATQLGEFHLFCAEYCGTDHSKMIGKVIVMPPSEYQAWLSGVVPDEAPVQSGRRLFTSFGCSDCHGQQGPTLTGLYGRQVELADGSTVVADENYIRESILDSTARIVQGFPPIMPSFRGQLSEDQLMHLLAYIKSLQQIDPQEVHKP
ncbi:MAG: cytochrome c oxidase subunit 2 [Phycisphaerae bacterium]